MSLHGLQTGAPEIFPSQNGLVSSLPILRPIVVTMETDPSHSLDETRRLGVLQRDHTLEYMRNR